MTEALVASACLLDVPVGCLDVPQAHGRKDTPFPFALFVVAAMGVAILFEVLGWQVAVAIVRIMLKPDPGFRGRIRIVRIVRNEEVGVVASPVVSAKLLGNDKLSLVLVGDAAGI